MTRYNDTPITSSKTLVADSNREFSKIKLAIDDTLSRVGDAPNAMNADLDMNSNDILNANAVGVQALSIAGVQVAATDFATSTLPTQTGHAGEILTTDGATASWITAITHGEIDLADFVTTPSSASAQINTAAAAALAAGKSLVSYDRSITYVLTTGVPIDLEGLSFIDIRGKIDTTNLDTVITTGCILLGGLGQVVGGNWRFGDIISSNPSGADAATTNPQVRIAGTRTIHQEWSNVRYIQFYHDYRDFPAGTGAPAYKFAGNAYNQIFFAGRVGKFELDSITRITDPLWFNENTIYGGRIYKTVFNDNGYIHNHNLFIRPLFEGSSFEMDIQTGHSNLWEGVRFESVTASNGITFGANADLNTVQRTWISGIDNREMIMNPSIGVPFTDNGTGNSFRYRWSEDLHKHEVLKFTSSVTIIGSGSGILDLATSNIKGIIDNDIEPTAFNKPAAIPGVQSTVFPNAFSVIAESDLIPVTKGSAFSFETKIRTGTIRYEVTIFDSDAVALDESTAFSSTALVYISDGLYQTTSNLSTTDTGNSSNHPLGMSILSDNVAYVRFRAMTGDVAPTVVDFLTINYYEPPEGRGESYASTGLKEKKPWLDTTPTTGHVPVGTVVGSPTGDHEAAFELSTKVTAEVANGATSVTVDAITNARPAGNIKNNDRVGIALDDGTVHWDTVAGLSGNTFTISALTSPIATVGAKALAGASVVFVRWKRYFSHDVGVNSMGISNTDPLPNITTANQATVFGHNTGLLITSADSATAMGGNALAALQTADGCSAFGNQALFLATGPNNTGVGKNAGSDIVGGADNTCVGNNADAGSAIADNRIVIGVGISGTADDQLSFGKFGNVVSNDFGTDALWSRISDERRKNILSDNKLGLDFINGLDTVVFTMKCDTSKTPIYGLTAQNVKEQLDKAGCSDFNGHVIMKDENKTQRLKHEALIFPLIKAVQELTARLEELENK